MPPDRKAYLDASFINELHLRSVPTTAPLAQEYVVAHEDGQHIQDLLGLLGPAQPDPQGAERPARSGSS